MTTAAVLEVASTSSPGTTYRVWVGEDGPIFCNCPGHRYVRADGNRRVCKHMKAITGSVVLPTATALAKGDVVTAAVSPRRDHRIRFIEVQETTADGTWVPMAGGDLSRFNNLEVA